MSRQKVIMTGVLGTAAIGAAMFTNLGGSKDNSEPQRHKANAKRDLGLSGAGLGGNAMTGSVELPSSTPSQNQDAERKTDTTAPRGNLPSGGVGGGEGAGGTTARKTQLPTIGNNGPADKSGAGADRDGKNTTAARKEDTKQSQTHAEQPGKLGAIQDFFGQAGAKTSSREDEGGLHNTRGVSEMGNSVPSKKRSPTTN